ncbi:MAG: DEAD/DEAH box helicase [Spirosomaceae bacterium]|nr:DEAD/DEAH box helicase [Spirosomataceae bacterium]
MLFKDLGLSEPILKAIQQKGYTEATPIQEKAIPHVLDRRDVLASAQTGTGKTAGFTLPMLHILSQTENPRGKRPIRALILTPTRELAAQILDNIEEYSKFLDIRSMVIFGGVNANPQIATLRKGVDILVATPGRLLDLYQQKALSLSQVEFFVLDEADRMLDMGFVRDINRVMQLMPERRQNLLFSATFSAEIKKLASGILRNPEMVEATPEQTTAEKVEQFAYRVDTKEKPDVLIKLINDGNWSQVLVFTRTKHRANRLSEKLTKSGIESAAIHGNKSQSARTKALDNFKEGNVRVLVATDIAARGLDIPLLPHVVNYELPNVPEDYVHRIGRTGRAGASGEAISLVAADETTFLRGIERLLEERIPLAIIDGFEPDPNASTEPPKQGGGGGGRNFRQGGGGDRSGGRPSGGGNRDRNTKGNFKDRQKSNYKSRPKRGE